MDPIDQFLTNDDEDYLQGPVFPSQHYEDSTSSYGFIGMMEEQTFFVKEESNEDTLSTVTTSSQAYLGSIGAQCGHRDASRVSNKSKLIQKREHARENARRKRQAEEPLKLEWKDSLSIEEKIEESESFKSNLDLNNPNVDEKTKKKIMQMIRNRISAQTSRDKKKIMFAKMENELSELRNENLALKARVAELEANMKQGVVCPACVEAATNSGSRSSPYVFQDGEEIGFGLSRSSSRQSSPYTQNIMLLVIVLVSMMALTGFLSPNGAENNPNGLFQSPSMSQGLVPILGPKVQGIFFFPKKLKFRTESKMNENQVAILRDFCSPHCERGCDLKDLVSEAQWSLVHKIKSERSHLSDRFYHMLMPRPRLDLVGYMGKEHDGGILLEENTEAREIIPLKYNEWISPNVSTAVAPVVFADNPNLDYEYLHLFVPSKNMRPLSQLRPDKFSSDQSEWAEPEEESFIELIAKVEGRRTIKSAIMKPDMGSYCQANSI